MLSYPVMRLFEQVGTVTLEPRGLYICFRASIRLACSGFCRLYYHTVRRTVRLGLFCQREDGLFCQGSVSARQLGLEEGGVFSLTEAPWLPFSEPLDGGIVVPGAVCCREGEMRRIVIADGPELPPEIMPYFCFLAPERVEGLPCLTMWVDRQGRPMVPEVSL